MTQTHTLLAAYAHPDDESFGSGGALARCAAEDGQTTLVCATRGEVGEISDPALATPDNLAEVRENELRCASQVLGVKELIFLGYRDSGMADTPDNDHPQAFCQAPGDEVVSRLVGIMRRVRPQVVLTFDPDGGYGHPDHIAIHRHTVAAFHAAGDPGRYPDQGPAWQPARLLYTILVESTFQALEKQFKANGIDTSQFDRLRESRVPWPEEQIHARLDVSAYVDAKLTAFNCHRTQFGNEHPFAQVPEAALKEIMSREHFALAWPEPPPGLNLSDLFDGIG